MIDSPQLCVQRRLAEYLNDSAAEFRDVASQFNALPVYTDLGGTLFITTALQVLCMRSDDTTVVEEHAPQWKLVALVTAAERFPELRQLLPARPLGQRRAQFVPAPAASSKAHAAERVSASVGRPCALTTAWRATRGNPRAPQAERYAEHG